MKKSKTYSVVMILFFITLIVNGQDGVMNYKELKTYLPESISGYESEEPEGQTMQMQGMTFSSAEAKYVNEEGEYIRITLLDYAMAANMYQAATAMWNAGMTFENDEMSAKSVKWDDHIVGWEEYRKQNREAKLSLGVGQRFFVSIEAGNQDDMKMVKEIAKDMNLEKLPVNEQ